MEKVSQMAPAVAADHLGPFGKKADIVFEDDVTDIDGFDEARPSCSRLKFGLGTKERLSASRTDIGALVGAVPVLP